MKKALVLGAGGFLGNHLVNRLKSDSWWVRGVDLKLFEFGRTLADDFILGDLRDPLFVRHVFDQKFDMVFQFAADMGGAGYLFTGDSDAEVMHNSALINLNALDACVNRQIKKIFYASSACVYPIYNLQDPKNPSCIESEIYPAEPDSDYGWEKLFSERLYDAYRRNYKLDVRIGRYHGIFGPFGTWEGGREKAPAAICRKVVMAKDGGEIEIWGDGNQTRSFLYIDDAIDATIAIMNSDYSFPLNVGSDELISINDFAKMVMKIAKKDLIIKHIEGPLGVRGRNSNNDLIEKITQWKPTSKLKSGVARTYSWIERQVEEKYGTKGK